MSNIEINDKRTIKEFKGMTFSKYKKSDVKKELLNNLSGGKIEPACYWAAEFICAGQFIDLWEIIILYASKHIHLANPKLPLYLDLRVESFKEILNSGYRDNIIKMRNNQKIRKLFAELICILALSKKKHTFDNIKIPKTDLNITKITHKLKADSINYAQIVFKKEDPKELFVGINEFAWNIKHEQQNAAEACYWFEWILGFEDVCKKTNKKYGGSRRSNMPVDNKYQHDIIWILWECILYESNRRNLLNIMKALLNLYCLKYSPGVKKRRKYLIYFAVNLLTEQYDISTPIYKNKSLIDTVTGKINTIYKQVKKNEIKPDTDYLFNNSVNKNLEKTVQKLDKMNSLMGFIPRNK